MQKLLQWMRTPMQTHAPACDANFEDTVCSCPLPWQAFCDSQVTCIELDSVHFLSAVAEVTSQGSYAVVGLNARARLIYVEPVGRILFG